VVVGRIVRPHGVRGDLVVDLAADLLFLVSEGTRLYLGEEKRTRRLTRLRRHGRWHLATFAGLTTRTQAEALRAQPMRLRLESAAALPPNVYYHWQIIGLMVESDTGEALGRLAEILQTGANDVYVIRDQAGNELLVPAIEDVIRSIDLAQARMIIHLIPGLRGDPGSEVA